MSDCACIMRCFRKFLVLFWGVFWVVAFILNFIGAGQFWGWFDGMAFKSNYTVIHHAVSQVHAFGFLPNLIFLLSLVLQFITAFYFVKAMIHVVQCCKKDHYITKAFVMGVTTYLLLYALKLILVAAGATLDHFATSAFALIVMQFLSLIYIMLEAKCCK